MPSFEQVYGQSAATAASNPTQHPNSQPSDLQTTNAPSAPSPQPSSLPPAAINLASKLFDLARTGSTPTLHTYITAGIPKNLTNSSGDTLLMLASYHGHAETVRMLLESGADANVLNARGQSPIAGAVFKGYDEVVRVLYEGGADVWVGRPNAVDCARMFKRGGCLKLFGEEEGEGTTIEVEG
ncbi:ankyrin repeat-containing domain protein [Paraphoma chrysanthemicola]|uniref:Ankyrin repeat-containing domain protein n=1 Tax=Paraphoma chrysanthemicola TaxID=798071 RepID=A0A8K0R0G3_9PLEO|nr:ankyrin repeat-containing domain protein [Paraphoma chrysanthemicola]